MLNLYIQPVENVEKIKIRKISVKDFNLQTCFKKIKKMTKSFNIMSKT